MLKLLLCDMETYIFQFYNLRSSLFINFYPDFSVFLWVNRMVYKCWEKDVK